MKDPALLASAYVVGIVLGEALIPSYTQMPYDGRTAFMGSLYVIVATFFTWFAAKSR